MGPFKTPFLGSITNGITSLFGNCFFCGVWLKERAQRYVYNLDKFIISHSNVHACYNKIILEYYQHYCVRCGRKTNYADDWAFVHLSCGYKP